MSLTAKHIAEIARLLDESRFGELSLEIGDFRLRIRRDGASGRRPMPTGPEAEPPAVAAPSAPAPTPSAPAQAGEVDVPAPLLGNFYRAPRPGDDPFVEVSSQVREDSVIGIVEVMKLMNPVHAGVRGMVTAILVENGAAIEQGQPLLRVARAG